METIKEDKRNRLTERQRDFCQLLVFVCDNNTGEAGKRAGYKHPASITRVLNQDKVREEIDRLRGVRESSLTPIRELFVTDSTEARLKLLSHLRSKNERISLEACKEILDRGLGKPIQPIIEGKVNPYDSQDVATLRQELLCRGLLPPDGDSATGSVHDGSGGIAERPPNNKDNNNTDINNDINTIYTVPSAVSVVCDSVHNVDRESERDKVTGAGEEKKGVFIYDLFKKQFC